MDTGAVLCCCK